MDGTLKKIVGILPPGFRFLSYKTDFYLPLSSNTLDRSIQMRHHSGGVETFGRLKRGATIQEAQTQIRSHFLAHAAEYPFPEIVKQMGFHTVVVSMRDDYVASIRPILLFIQFGGACLLIIGMVNFSGLLLVRASSRAKEAAVRQALGATPWMILGDAAIDTMFLTLAAALVAIVLGSSAIFLNIHFADTKLPLDLGTLYSSRSAWTVILITVALGIGLAIPVALVNMKTDAAKALQSISRGGGTSCVAHRVRYASVVVQIALAFVLISTAGLLSVSLVRAMKIMPGFAEENILTAEVNLLGDHYKDNVERGAFAKRLLETLAQQPELVASGISNNIPLSGKKSYNRIAIEGIQPAPGADGILHYTYFISGEYFKTMGIPLKEGRLLATDSSERDNANCVVDENFAKRYWPLSSAIGHIVFYGPAMNKDEGFTIVGIVGAVKQTSLTDDHGNGGIYFSYNAIPDRSIYLVLRSKISTKPMDVLVNKWIRAIDPEIPVSNICTMESRLADSVGSRRWPAILTGVFAGLGLFLTSIATYGMMSFAANQRRREIGIRLALGAQPSQIQFQFIKLGLAMLLMGTLIGVLGSWAGGQFIRSLLFSVPLFHVPTLLGTLFATAGVLLLACWWPARRAANLNPTQVLAEE